MLSNSYITNKVKVLLGIEDTTLYDARLEMLVGGAISKLENEGIENDFDEGSNLAFDYLICLSYQVALDLNLDIDLQTFYVQYITRVNELRCSIKAKQN